MNTRLPKYLLRLAAALSFSLLASCLGTEHLTNYSLQKEQDKEANRTPEEQRDFVAGGIGSDTYADLVDKIGQSNLDLLTYGAGESNLVKLINTVISCGGTADKLVDLISNTPSSPTKISADTVLGLLNETDYHLRNESPLPNGDDTIAKMANMICQVVNMDDLVYIVNNVQDYAGAGSPPETEAIRRLSVVLALVNESASNMPTIINEVADTADGRTKLLRIMNEVTDLRDLTTIINSTNVLQNLLTVIENVENVGSPNGTDALITTLNLVDRPADMAYLVNELDAAVNDINNDEDFEDGTLTYQNWATAGHGVWTVDTSSASQGSYAAHSPALANNQVATLELAVNIITTDGSPQVSFARRVSSQSNSDYLKFYIDDELKGIWSGTVAWSTLYYALPNGVHRLRWEYVKDGSGSAGSDRAWVDNIVLPGNKGTARTASEKVAILLNQLDISSQQTVGEIMNGVNTDTYGYAGLDNLVSVINQVEYPLTLSGEPRLVSIVNGITSVTTMNALMRGLTPQGADAIVEILDHAPDVTQVSDLVNQMDSAGLATKMTDILNGLDSVGQYNIAKMVEGVDNANLVILIRDATQTSHMSDIFNNIYLHGSVTHTTVSTSSGSSGGAKLTDVINKADASATLTITGHMVRLVNDIAASPLGASSVGKIVGNLNPLATSYSGQDRMIALMETLSGQGSPTYTDALSTATNDNFGRVVTLINAMGTNGPDNMTRLINEISCNDINNTSNCRVYNLADMVTDSNRVIYVSRLISEMTNVDLVIQLLNDPLTNFAKVQTMLNIIGDDTYTGGTPPVDTYDNQYEWPSTDDDYLGRMVVTINNVSGSGGISNIIELINSVDYVNGTTDNFSILINLIKTTNRVVYMTRLISDATNLDLVIELINQINPAVPAEVSRLRTMVNTFGNESYGASYGVGSIPSPLYDDAMDTNTNDNLGRMIIFLNDLTAQVQATGSSMSQAITNAVTMIMDSYDLNFVLSFLSDITRIRYVTHMVAQIDNIGLMMTIINGQAGDGSNGADITKMLTLMNNFGGSTRKGENYSTGKVVGDMTMFADVIDILGAGRPVADQARIIQLVNNVVYCGIRPQYDRNIPANPTSGYFYGCDSHVNYDYNSNKGNVSYDRRHRLANVMLGLTSADVMAVIVGDVTDTDKTVRIMNGTRRINTIIHTVNWVPAEVTRDLMNYTNNARIYTSLVYMANNLSPDEYEAAQAFAAMLHTGTGLANTSSSRSSGSCYYYTGIGPKRMANLLNAEPGAYLEGILAMFGWRIGIPAMICGFGTTNQGTPQYISGSYGSFGFARTENVYRNANQTGSLLYTYEVLNTNHCRSYEYDCNCDTWGCDTCYSMQGYMKEKSGGMGFENYTDKIVWDGWTIALIITIDPGLGSIWNILKGDGFVGWMMQNGGSMGMPPVDTAQYGSPSCTNSSYGNEWDCIRHGKDSSPNLSYYRWGNYCSLPQYSTASTCESNGGRWMPDKNYSACFYDPATKGRAGYSNPYQN